MVYRAVFLFLFCVLAQLGPTLASVLHMWSVCPKGTVWYSFVGKGFPQTPDYWLLDDATTISYDDFSDNAGISLKVARVPEPGAADITQIEFGTDPYKNKIWYDVSLIDGSVFSKEGVNFYADTCPSKSFPQCKAVVCRPNQICEDAYKYPTEDENTRSCSLDTKLTVGFCTGDKVHGPNC